MFFINLNKVFYKGIIFEKSKVKWERIILVELVIVVNIV